MSNQNIYDGQNLFDGNKNFNVEKSALFNLSHDLRSKSVPGIGCGNGGKCYYKKPKFWVIVFAIIIITVIGIGLMTHSDKSEYELLTNDLYPVTGEHKYLKNG